MLLSKLRTKKTYTKSNVSMKNIINKVPIIGQPFVKIVQRLKRSIKQLIIPKMFFEDIGFKYLGPIDGHNIEDMELIFKRAKELGMKAMAITDHGVMYGAIDFYKACKKEGIKPIIGCEVYVAPRSRFDKESIDKQYYHLILLAKNNQGYKNLSKLVSIGFTEGYYYKPRIDLSN